jgi:DsbC/DsbD-like thiol-disulfide interchange protein
MGGIYNRGMRAAFLFALLASVTLLAQSDFRLLPPSATPKYLMLATSASSTTVKAGATVSLVVDIAPNPGIHVYAPGAKGYRPIALTVAPLKETRVAATSYPKSERLFFAPLKETVPVYQKPFRITRQMTVSRAAKPGSSVNVSGTVEYQACDDKVCFEPASVPVNWTITVK